MLRRLGIRAKVMAVLAVPMVVLLVAGAYISLGALGDWRYARTVDDTVSVLQRYGLLVAAVQDERVAALGGASPDDTAKARALTDSTISQVQPRTDGLDLSGFSGTVSRQRDAVRTAYDTVLPQARERVDSGGQRAQVARGYADVVSAQLGFVEQLGQTLENRELGAYIGAYAQVARLEDALVQERVSGDEILRDQAASAEEINGLGSQGAVTESARERARSVVGALGSADLQLPAGDPTSVFTNMRSHLQQADGRGIALVDPVIWEAAVETQLTGLDNLNTRILDAAHGSATAAAADARNRAFVTVGVVVLAAAASLVLALLVARRIVVPLRRLTAAASQVREELPRLVEQVAVPGEGPQITLPAIPVESRDEVGRLASAFNAVNSTTVQVAQEQAALRGSIAEMFVNVARRDQALLNRQLSFIDSLERTEEDPTALANLFRLDHLATRMRRNAESLLVLAGIDSGRRPREPMPLSDVIRTASSEIEQYERVELDLQVDPQMLGFHALAAAHLMAELLENATVFSEPETPVVVSTAVTGESVVVRVVDRGLGMSPEELTAANAKIASTSAADALGVQRLGLFVVGRLARRVGADVRLAPGSDGVGTEAVVRFPAAMFVAADLAPYLQPGGITGEPVRDDLPGGDGSGPFGGAAGAPVAQRVDLGALTDGETAQGLPRRRRSGEDAGAVPVAGQVEVDGAVAGRAPAPETGQEAAATTAAGLPVRGRATTFDEERIVLPEAPAVPTGLPSAGTTGAAGWTPPLVAPAPAGGLPSRSRTSAAPEQGAAGTRPDEAGQHGAAQDGAVPGGVAAGDTPVAPQARTGLFSGFRGRDALTAAAAEATGTGEVPGVPTGTAVGSAPAGAVAAGAAADAVVPAAPGGASGAPADGPVSALGDDGAVAVDGAPGGEPVVAGGVESDVLAQGAAVPGGMVIPQLAPDEDEWAPYDPTPTPSPEPVAAHGDEVAPVGPYPGVPDGAWSPDGYAGTGQDGWAGYDDPVRETWGRPDGTAGTAQGAWDRPDDPGQGTWGQPDGAVQHTWAEPEGAGHGTSFGEAAAAQAASAWSAPAAPAPAPAPAPQDPVWPASTDPAPDTALRQDPPGPLYERTLDEERAWRQTGAIPVVPEPVAPAQDGPTDPTADEQAARSWLPQVDGWAPAPRFDAPGTADGAVPEAPGLGAPAQPGASATTHHDPAVLAGSGTASDATAPLSWGAPEVPSPADAPPVLAEGALGTPEADAGVAEPAFRAPGAVAPGLVPPGPLTPGPVTPGVTGHAAPVVPAWTPTTAPLPPAGDADPSRDAPLGPTPLAPTSRGPAPAVPSLADGAVPTGTTPNDAVPDAAVPNGAVSNGALLNSAVPNGAVPDGTPSSGLLSGPIAVPAGQRDAAQPGEPRRRRWGLFGRRSAEPAPLPPSIVTPPAGVAAWSAGSATVPAQGSPVPDQWAGTGWPVADAAAAGRDGAGTGYGSDRAATGPEAGGPAGTPLGGYAADGVGGPDVPAPAAAVTGGQGHTASPALDGTTPTGATLNGNGNGNGNGSGNAPHGTGLPPSSPGTDGAGTAQGGTRAAHGGKGTAPGSTGAAHGGSGAPQVSAPTSPRIGTLDDEVAAMLALRSDIQEQALSELSQLSAYRPRTVDRPAEQLRRRVPSTVPSAAPAAGSSGPVQRDAEELRSRLSSFQSGTVRGRRAARDDPDAPAAPTQDDRPTRDGGPS